MLGINVITIKVGEPGEVSTKSLENDNPIPFAVGDVYQMLKQVGFEFDVSDVVDLGDEIKIFITETDNFIGQQMGRCCKIVLTCGELLDKDGAYTDV